MIQEPFAKGRSPIHRTNPVLRVSLATVYSFSVALMAQPTVLASALCFSIGLIAAAQLPIRPVTKRIALAGGVLLFVWLVVPTTYGGNPITHVGPISISQAGVRLCLQITLKALAILLAFTALVATMPTTALGHALDRLGMPTKLAQLLLLAYRYIFLIEQEYRRLFRAAKIRNFRPATNMHTYRTYAYMVGMLFVRASERADRVYQAMKCRGFNGQFYTLANYPPTHWNHILGISSGSVNLLMIYLEWLR
jgi:cobalt/nickel transport system permease protein